MTAVEQFCQIHSRRFALHERFEAGSNRPGMQRKKIALSQLRVGVKCDVPSKQTAEDFSLRSK